MTAAERGVLLLCCALGEPDARPLSGAAFQRLGRYVQVFDLERRDRELETDDLLRFGLRREEAGRIVWLLSRTAALARYLEAGRERGLFPLTVRSEGYPEPLLRKWSGGVPPVFFCAGDPALLKGPFIGLAGSRRLTALGERFAREAGAAAAEAGFTLVTGGAVGADRVATEACLNRGGKTVVFVPDDLRGRAREAGPNRLLLSAEGYDLDFTARRALSRNAWVHKMGETTVIVQTGDGKGGTWRGAVENLRHGWSRLYVHDDGSPGARNLIARGGTPLRI